MYLEYCFEWKVCMSEAQDRPLYQYFFFLHYHLDAAMLILRSQKSLVFIACKELAKLELQLLV